MSLLSGHQIAINTLLILKLCHTIPILSDIAKLQEQARRKAAEDGDDDERFQDPDNETGLFNTAPYEADDEEADQIYDAIDAKLDERRKARR